MAYKPCYAMAATEFFKRIYNEALNVTGKNLFLSSLLFIIVLLILLNISYYNTVKTELKLFTMSNKHTHNVAISNDDNRSNCMKAVSLQNLLYLNTYQLTW